MKPSTSMFAAVTLALGVATTYLVTPSVAETFIIMPGELQEALDEVQPGDTIELSPGHYYESVVTKRAGTADKPITIHGESYRAVLKGDADGSDHMFDIQHSYYVLDRFTIDGHLGGDEYQDKCLYVQTNRKDGERAHEIEFNGHSFRSSINGIVISNMDIKNCGGECVRMRYFITYAQVFNNRIENCGTHDFVVYPDNGGKNGEGIYLGTSSNQWDDGKNPSNEPDESQYNHIFDNYFDTQGNEGLDIKEGSSNNVVENNYCTGQKDPESACLDARGSGNIIRFNKIEGNTGAGVRLGGHKIDGYTYGVDNEVYGNMMKNNEYAGVKATVGPQGKVCENNIDGSEPGRGDGMDDVNPSASCPHHPSMAITARVGGNSEEEEEEAQPEPTRAPVTRPPYMSAESYRPGSRSP